MENLIKELETYREKMNETIDLKNKAVRKQEWEKAAAYRDEERQYIHLIEIIEKKISENNI